MNLYELTSEYEKIQELLETEAEENDGLVSDELLEALTAASDGIDAKVEACAKVVKNLEAERDAVDAERARLKTRSESLGKNIDRLKKAVITAMERSGKAKVKTALFTVYPRESVSVDYEDEKKLPRDFCATEVITKYKPDKLAMRKFMQDGGVIPGAWLVTNKSLQIR